MSLPLSGLGVLVTRPARQAAAFIDLLRQTGAETFALPAIDIQALALDASSQQHLQQFGCYQIAVFVSANAVHYALPHIETQPMQLIAAIGEGTARALTEHGWHVGLLANSGYTSEDLLALPALQADAVSGKRILIIRGRGGRETLANTFRARGARVDYAEVYQRGQPQTDTRWLAPLWQTRIQIVCVTSNEALENLYHMLNQYRDQLLNTLLLVPGSRSHQLAESLGFQKIIQAASASDNDMLQRIKIWHQTGV